MEWRSQHRRSSARKPMIGCTRQTSFSRVFIEPTPTPIWGGSQLQPLSALRAQLRRGLSATHCEVCGRGPGRPRGCTEPVGATECSYPPAFRPRPNSMPRSTTGRPCSPNVGGHGLWLNSKALGAAGITAIPPDPPHGALIVTPMRIQSAVWRRPPSSWWLPRFRPADRLRTRGKALLYAIFTISTASALWDSTMHWCRFRGKDPGPRSFPPGVPRHLHPDAKEGRAEGLCDSRTGVGSATPDSNSARAFWRPRSH